MSECLSLPSAVGEPRRITRAPGKCRELIDWLDKPTECGRPATAWTAHPPGRSKETECLCDEHGGEPRALDLLRRSWHVLAPDAVGDDVAVLDAGGASLTSQDVYVCVRPHGARWVVALGIGGHTRSLRGSYSTAAAAEAAGVAAWRQQLKRDVEDIRAARGGTLAWGMPVVPREAPIVLRCRSGQSAYAALTEVRLTELLGPPSEGSLCDPCLVRETVPVLVWRRGDHELVLDGRDLAYIRRAGDIDWRAARNVSPLPAKEKAEALLTTT